MRDLIEKIKNYLSTLTFKNVILLSLGALFVIVILNFIVTPPAINNVLTVNDNQTITNSEGQVISYYNFADNDLTGGGGKFITIYVEDLKGITGPEIRALIARVLQKKGLRERDVSINIEQMSDIDEEGFDYTKSENDYDPTDPSTFIGKTPEELGINFETEPIEGLTFAQFASTNPPSEFYDIIIVSPNVYTVILKNGYTEIDFRDDILSNFADEGAQIEFIDIYKYKETAN